MTTDVIVPPRADPRRSAGRYDALTRALHWITAVLVVTLYGLAQLWGFAGKGTPLRHGMQLTHVSLGVLLTLVLVVRIFWRASSASTRLANAGWSGLAAKAVHLLLYALLATQAFLGWNFQWSIGQPLSFFGLFPIPSPFDYGTEGWRTFAFLHYWTANAILILAGLHAAVALGHHYVLRDGVLARMFFGRAGERS